MRPLQGASPMARERLSMKFDSKTAGKTGQLLFLQKACSAIGGSPFRRPAPPPVSKESPPYPKLHMRGATTQ